MNASFAACKREDSLWRQPGQLLTDADLPLIATRYYGIQLMSLAQKGAGRIVLPAERGEPAAGPPKKVEEKANLEQLSLAKALKVVRANNFFSVESVQSTLIEKLRPDTVKLLTDGPYALWYLTEHGTLRVGHDYCWAIVGLTEAPAKGRAARMPYTWSTSMRHPAHEPRPR